MLRQTSGATTLIATLFVFLFGCQTSPTGRTQFVAVPEEEVEKTGSLAFQEMKAKEPIDTDAQNNAYVNCVAKAITAVVEPKREWEVVVFKSDQINAFALPGGKIGVYTGILKIANTAEQLAAIIGHEVAHVTAQHGRERISQALAAQGALTLTAIMLQKKNTQNYQLIMGALGLGAQVGVLLPFGRAQESEADVVGLQYLAQAGFDPRGSVTLWENMSKAGGAQPPTFLSSHPANAQRIETLKSHMNHAMGLYQQAKARPSCVL